MLQIHTFEMNPFGVNTYIVYNPDTLDAALVDPGMIDDAERQAVQSFLAAGRLTLRHILNTHLHIDHCLGAAWARDSYGAPVSAAGADAFLGSLLQQQAQAFHMPVSGVPPLTADVTLSAGDTVRLGDDLLEVLAVPGHSPGSLAFYSPSSHFVITGDALFYGSIGRTDLPGGSAATLVSAIRSQLMTLPDDTTVYPGHGPATTIGRERRSNPYI